MSANKYANLPDIDTAPDVYETEDVFPSSREDGGDSSDDEPSTARARARTAADGSATNPEELDVSNLISPEDASKHFRKAERARRHQRTRYVYPPSPLSSATPSRPSSRSPSRALPLPARLRALQAELSALEAELEDPSNPALQARAHDGEGVDPGEMIRGLVDVRRRLERVRRAREGRGRLVGIVVGEGEDGSGAKGGSSEGDGDGDEEESDEEDDEDGEDGDGDEGERDRINADHASGKGDAGDGPEGRRIVEMDKRVGELEKLVGSVSATLDETTPLTPPLLPMLMRLNNQLTLLTQPRHIDSVSRRLKLLLSDLERVSASQMQKRQQSASGGGGAIGSAGTVSMLTPAQDAVLPLLSRLAPSLPHIPHILTRLRTLSALHGSASEFQSTMAALEEEQRRTREGLEGLSGAVADVEASLDTNRTTVAGNVKSLEERVEKVLSRLEEVAKSD